MPFTVDEFFQVFARYNEAIWPLQVVTYVCGAVAIASLLVPGVWQARAITAILAAMWAINGIAYHWIFFSAVNPAAHLFGAVFVVEAVALAASTFVFPFLRFRIGNDGVSMLGLLLIVFATIAYPIWGWLSGHVYPANPVFGVAPCPTTIFSIGVLLLGTWSAVRWMLVVPIVWSVIGGSAALLLHVPQDFGLIAAGLIALATATMRFAASSVKVDH